MNVEPVAAPVRGWRIFHPRANGELTSYSDHFVWNGGHAVCLASEKHDAPAFDCTCGYWMFKQREDAEALAATVGGDVVLAEVEGWGIVIEHEDGYRCRWAQVVSRMTIRNPTPFPGPTRIGIRTQQEREESWRRFKRVLSLILLACLGGGIPALVVGDAPGGDHGWHTALVIVGAIGIGLAIPLTFVRLCAIGPPDDD